MGVVDGQAVSAAVTNPAFLDANADDVANGKIGFHDTDLASGPFIDNTQRVQNRLMTATGVAETPDADDGMTYSDTAPNQRVVDQEDHEVSIAKLDSAFHPTTGHKHTGVTGDAPPVSSNDIADTPLQAAIQLGNDFTTVAAPALSSDVTTLMVGKTASSGPTVEGVVVDPPYNRILLRSGPSGPNPLTDEALYDDDGNVVYGRLTFALAVWTLTYFVLIDATETAYSMPASTPVRWYYPELFNPLSTTNPPPTYTQIPGMFDDCKGVRSVQEFAEAVAAFGDIILKAGANVTITRAGKTFTIASSGGGGGSGAGYTPIEWNQSYVENPTEAIEFQQEIFKFENSLSQRLFGTVRVPTGYAIGDQISLFFQAYSPSTANSFLLKTRAFLIRPGTDAAGDTTNGHTSTNVSTSNSAPANKLQDVSVDLTDGSGQINGIAVSPGDVLEIYLERNASDTSDAADIRVRGRSGQVQFYP